MKKLLLAIAATTVVGAQAPSPFTLVQVLDFPFPDHLVAAPAGAAFAWTLSERGERNIYVAEGPAFAARRVTPYRGDEGQELTSLSFTPDGRTIVYVRGGDHGSNWPAEGNLQPDPNGTTTQPRVQIWSIAIAGGAAPRLIGEGDEPTISPAGDRVAFVKDHRIWLAPLDGSKPAEQAFFARGASESPVWSPDGRRIAFVSDRDDHSFIGIFTSASEPLRYLAPSTSRDSEPLWSLDAGRELLFVRQPGRGGTPRSALAQPPSPWELMTAGAQSQGATTEGPTTAPNLVWKSGRALVDSIPRFAGGVNLHWAADGRIVFLSYQDGWPHLYVVRVVSGASRTPDPAPVVSGFSRTLDRPSETGDAGAAKLLTPGAFMVEHVALTPDARFLVYSANTGSDSHDIDRRHLFKVPVDGSSAPVALTSGAGLEWGPVVTGDGKTVAFLRSTAQRPPVAAVMPIAGGAARDVGADRVPPAFPSAQLITPEPVTFRASDGVEVHGQLFKTANGPARRPALVYVHGGPTRQMLLGFHYMDYYANDYAANQYLASRGFIVLSVNYRLGIGYGHSFHFPENAGQRGASEYLDVVAGAKLLQSRADVDSKRLGIWGGSYGGYLTALALGRNSDIFAAGVDIHGVHNWERQGRSAPNVAAAMAGDGITQADLDKFARITFESSPVSSVKTWTSPVLLIHADDDRNVEFHQTVDLKQRLLERGVNVEELVIPDDIHDFLLFRSWKTVATATGEYFERRFLKH
jgi:dipeptidyl aminopeptidase/acylaminoacyl peptidase